MRLIVEALLIGITNLFLIWLYATNKQFAKQLNRVFEQIQSAYSNTQTSFPNGVKGLVLASAVTALLIAIMNQSQMLSVFGYVFVFLLIAIPSWLSFSKLIHTSSIDNICSKITRGELNLTEVIRVRDTIKHYFVRVERAKREETEEIDIVLALKNVLTYWLHPKFWQRRLIPKITAIPILSGLFYYSPNHTRFSKERQIINSIHQLIRNHPYKLNYRQAYFDDDFMLVTFDNTRKNTLARARSLAKRLEQNHKLNADSILVQDHNDTCKLFIPLIKQDQDS